MLIRQISLKDGLVVGAANIQQDKEIQQALTQLEIPPPKPVIVLVGGAAGIGLSDKMPVHKAVGIVAKLAEEAQAVVIDGGTQAGIMEEIGKQRKQNKFAFPLIGVVVDPLLFREEPRSILDAHHTHFILVPGKDWGDESAWIAKVATMIAGDKKSITVLVNGGNISKMDVEHSVLADRPTFVMRGTGRLADEIAMTEKIIAVDISRKPEAILEFLKTQLV